MAKKPEFWEYPLGADADVNALERDLDNTKGDATLRGLFPVLTGTRLRDGGIPPQRKDLNALFKLIGENIYFLQRGGQYEWDAALTYDKDAIVLKSGNLYQAQSQNENTDPLTNPGIWKKVVQVTAEDLQALRNALPERATTQTEGTTVLASEISDDQSTSLTPGAVLPLKTQVENISTDVNDIKTELSLLQGGSGDMSATLGKLQSDITACEDANGRQDLTIKAHGDRLDDVESRLTSLSSIDTRAIEQSLNEHSNTLSEHQRDIDDIKTHNEGFSSNLNELNSKVTLAENAAKGAKDSVDTLTRTLDNLSARDQELQDAIDSHIGILPYSRTTEFEQGQIVELEGLLYKALQDVKKAGQKPVKPVEPILSKDATEEEIEAFKVIYDQYVDAMEEYKTQNELWENAATQADLSDKNYWECLDNSCGVYEYSQDEMYNKGDVVINNGSLFVALESNTNTSTSNTNTWKLLTVDPQRLLGVFLWTADVTFTAGQLVLVDRTFYKCKKANQNVNPATDLTGNYWTSLNVQSSEGDSGEVSNETVKALADAIQALPNQGIFRFNPENEYNTGDIVNYGLFLWRANSKTSDTPTLTSSTWTRLFGVELDDIFGLMQGVYLYSTTREYKKNMIVEYGGQLWRNNSTSTINVTPTEETGSPWTRLGKADSNDPALKALSSRIDDTDSNVHGINERLTSAEGALGTVQNTLTELDLDGIKTAAETAQSTAEGLRDRVSALEAEDLNSQVQALDQAIKDEKDARLLSDGAQNTLLQNIQDTVSGNKSQQDTKNAEIDRTLQALDTTVQQLGTKVDGLDGIDISEVQGKVQTLESQAGDLSTRVQALEASGDSGLKDKVAALEPKVQSLETSLAQTDDKVEELQKIDHSKFALKSEIPEVPDMTAYTAIPGKVQALESDVETLKGIDHSQYALKTDIPEVPEMPDLTEYAKKTDIPEIDTSTLATKSSVDTLSTQVQKNTTDIANLKKNSGSSGGSGSGGSMNVFSHYFNVVDGDVESEDLPCLAMFTVYGKEDPIDEITLDGGNFHIHMNKDLPDIQSITIFFNIWDITAFKASTDYINVHLWFDWPTTDKDHGSTLFTIEPPNHPYPWVDVKPLDQENYLNASRWTTSINQNWVNHKNCEHVILCGPKAKSPWDSDMVELNVRIQY
jgi:predicted  nucleic acid-binding Zn-ribbon protein